MLTQGNLHPVPVRILLRRRRGGVWANLPVTFHSGEESFAATSDALGFISLALLPVPNTVLTMRANDKIIGQLLLERLATTQVLTF